MKNLALILIIIFSVYGAKSQDFRHQVGIFLGASSGTHAGGETGLTIGAEYEYFMSTDVPKVGIGFSFDAMMLEQTHLLMGVPFFLHIFDGLRVGIAPSFAYTLGWEDPRFYDGTGYPVMMPIEEQARFFLRYSAGYELKFQNYVVTPAITADVISSNLYLLYGIDFAITF